MPVTGVRGRQILDDSVTRADINVTASGSALITKVLVGAGLIISSSTGADSGTGDVTVALGNSGVTAGTYGSSSLVPVITVDQYGRITAISTAAGSGGMTNPMIAVGDMIYGGSSGAPTRLPAGTAGQALVSAGAAAPVWTTLTLENLPDAWVKRAVKVATTTNITLSGTQTIDGIAVVAGDRVLVKDQTASSANGIYIVASGAWTRAADADTSSKIAGGTVAVDQGTVNGGLTYDNDFRSTDTLGTTNMVWNRVIDTGYIIPVAQGGTGATTLTGVMVGNGTGAVTAVAGSASQLLRRNAGNTGYEFFTHDFASTAGATFTGQIITTRANNTGAGLGQIYLNGNTGNRIDFNANGFAAPSLTTISTGTKIILYPAITATTVDYAIGIDASTLWFSVPSTTAAFRFYGATTLGATLTGAGALTLSSTATATQFIRTGGTSAQFLKADGSIDSSTYLTANQSITLSGDATGSGTTSIAVTLSNSGVTAGTYRSVTVNAKGLVTGGTNPTTLSGYGITDALPISGGTLTGTLIFGNATSPNSHTIQFGDNTGWTLRFMTNVSGTPTARFSFGDNGTLTAVGQYITTRAWNAGDANGQIYLNGTTGNRIDWSTAGVAAPSFTTRSAGTKLVLYPVITASAVDFGIGIESNATWFSVPTATGYSFKWYGGTTSNMELNGANLVIGTGAGVGSGRLTVNAATGGTSLYLTDAVNSTLIISHPAVGVTRFTNGASVLWMQESGGSVTIGNSTSTVARLFVYNDNLLQPALFSQNQSTAASLQDTVPLKFTDLYNSGANGHNLFFNSSASSGVWEYNITKTFGGILSFGVSSANASLTRQMYLYDGGQLRLSNYTTTTSFSGTAVGVLAFTSNGSIITIPTPGGGSGITGTGAQNYITKFSNAGATSIGNSQIFDNGTNVGISTASPNQKFEVMGDTVRIRLSSATAPTVYYFDLESRYDASNTINMYGAGGVNFFRWISNTGAISLNPNGSNVGINTTTPDAPLRVAGAINGTHAIFGNVDSRGLEFKTVLVAGTNEAGSILNARGVGSGTLIIQTDGTERARFAANGDAGLGTGATISNTTNYTSFQVNGTSGGLLRFSYAGTNAGHVYGSSAELGINAPSVFNLYINNSQKFNVIAAEVNVYETLYARKLGAQIQLAGGVATASGIFQAGNNNMFIADWNTGTNGIVIDVSNGILRTRSSQVNGAYIEFQRSGSTIYGYAGNSAQLFGAGFNGNTELGFRSEGALNFGTTGGVAVARMETTGRLRLPLYTATSSFTGTAVGYLGFDSLGNILTTNGTSQWITNSSDIYYTTGNVGIGVTVPLDELHISTPNATANYIRFTQTSQRTYRVGIPASQSYWEVYDNDATSSRLRVLSTGRVMLNSYGAGSVTGTPVSFLAVDNTGTIIEQGLPINALTVEPGPLTWSLPSAATILNGSSTYIFRLNLASYSQVRLHVNKLGTAGQTGSRLILRYSTTYTQTASSYVDIGTSEVSCAVNVSNTYVTSSWIGLAAGAKADVFVSVIGLGGNSTALTFGAIMAEFR